MRLFKPRCKLCFHKIRAMTECLCAYNLNIGCTVFYIERGLVTVLRKDVCSCLPFLFLVTVRENIYA